MPTPDYPETLSYLFSRLPMYQREGKAAYKADLSNTLRLARMCGNPERELRCVHIAGTNGKGSTSHILASVFQACGYRTGLMTSPHYKDFRERIRIDGEPVSEQYVVDWVERYRERTEAISPSFFELTVLMGFDYFVAENVDIAIIETGLGGRLDSTNIVTPELSLITSIGLDHTQFLGDTLEAIAKEKGGIIKPGRPVVIGPGNEEVEDTLRQIAEEREAAFHLVALPTVAVETDLRGSYQQKNIASAMRAIELMREGGWDLPPAEVSKGLGQVAASTGMMGRWQLLTKEPKTIADSAHNPQGIQTVLDELANEPYDQLHIVLAMVNDKDVTTVLRMLPTDATYYISQAAIPRAMAVHTLAEHLVSAGLTSRSYPSIADALESAQCAAEEGHLVLVTGSIFTVAEVV